MKKLLISFRGILKAFLSLILNYFYDAVRFSRYSCVFGVRTKAQLEARIIATYHTIEKAFSLPQVRVGFGKRKAQNLINLLLRFSSKNYHISNKHYAVAISVLKKYFQFCRENNVECYDLESQFNLLDNQIDIISGSKTLKKEELFSGLKTDFKMFSESRHSVRHFSSEPVSDKIIEEAVSIARKTPSVCNRQSWKVYLIKDSNLKKHIMHLQNGNAGFGDRVDSYLAITTNIQTFFGVGERNQAYVDGGLFSMSLMYSLHSLGLGSCPLNWCVTKKTDQKLHKILNIPNYEIIIMLMAVGNYPESIDVAISNRRDLGEIICRR